MVKVGVHWQYHDWLVLNCHIMVEPEAISQQERKVDAKDLTRSKAVMRVVFEFESRGEFLPKVRPAWSGHPAAPRLAARMAGRNTVSTSRSEEKTAYAHLFCSGMTRTRKRQ
jgi:hypothetical protein